MLHTDLDGTVRHIVPVRRAPVVRTRREVYAALQQSQPTTASSLADKNAFQVLRDFVETHMW